MKEEITKAFVETIEIKTKAVADSIEEKMDAKEVGLGGGRPQEPSKKSQRRSSKRFHNKEAHAVAQAMIGQLYVIRVDSPLYLGRESLEREEGFLQTGLLPAELEKSKKYAFLRRAKRYMLVGDSLYMKGADLVMRRVPWKEEIYKVLEENHEGSCGGHFASKITLHKILQEGYVWPSIQRDVHHWCKSCKECQSMASRVLRSEIRGTILAYDVFEKSGIDAIGPLPITARGKCYILTAVDYLSRWAEAKPVMQITSKDVAKFVYEDICCKFGMPLELLSDKGPGFRGELVDYLCEKLHVRRRFTTPYYPQCNGMNERFNGELIRMLTKMTQSNVKTWDLELPCALWAYRTAIKTGTGFSPFHLIFGKEALLPIEVEIPALKMMLKLEEANHDALKERLLYLQCLQLDRALALEHYEQLLHACCHGSRQGMMDYMTLQLATRAIDELVFGRDQMCTIWADHYNNARRVARYYVFCGLSEGSEVYGMFHCWSELDRYYEVDREAKRILEACYSRAQKIVEKNEVLIKELTDLLIDVKVVKKEDFWRLAEQHGNFQELPPLVVDICRKKLEEFREQMIMEKRYSACFSEEGNLLANVFQDGYRHEQVELRKPPNLDWLKPAVSDAAFCEAVNLLPSTVKHINDGFLSANVGLIFTCWDFIGSEFGSALKKLVHVSVQTLGADKQTKKSSVPECAVEDSSRMDFPEVVVTKVEDVPTVMDTKVALVDVHVVLTADGVKAGFVL
ncbi:hypothetical protein L7F22_023759 [Adiantum nelumboides]|nr:hypothetical protein [Adiantum nelumboides]